MSYPNQYPHQQPTWPPQQPPPAGPQSPLANTPAYLNPAFAPIQKPPGQSGGGLLGSLKKVVTAPRPQFQNHQSSGSYGGHQSPQQYAAPHQGYPPQQQQGYVAPTHGYQQQPPVAQPHYQQPAFSPPPVQAACSQAPPAYQATPTPQPQQQQYQRPPSGTYQPTPSAAPTPGFTPGAPYQQAAGLNWNDLFETTTTPPKPTPKLLKILKGVGECIIKDGGVDGCPSSVISPAKMAMYYGAAAGYSSDCLRFFQSAANKPNRLAEFYKALGCEYVLIPPQAGENTLLPALTLKGFEQWSAIQILLFPEFAHQQLTAYLSNPAHTIKDPDTGTFFPSGGPPRTVLPPVADPTIYQRYGSLWETTMKAVVEQSDIDSPFDQSAQKLTEAMEQLNRKTAGEQKLMEEHKRSIHELYAEISRLQQLVQDKENEVLKVKASRQESDHLASEKEREIKRLNAAAEVKQRDFLEAMAKLEEKDTKFQRAMEEKDSELAQTTRILQEKDVEVRQAQQATEAKVEELRQLRVELQTKDFETAQARRTAESKESEISILKTQLRDLERDVQKAKGLQQESDREAGKLRRERTDLVEQLAETKKALAKKDAEIHVLKTKQVLPLGSPSSGSTTPPISTTSSPSPYAPRGYEAARRPTMESPAPNNGGRRPTIGAGRSTLPYPENP